MESDQGAQAMAKERKRDIEISFDLGGERIEKKPGTAKGGFGNPILSARQSEWNDFDRLAEGRSPLGEDRCACPAVRKTEEA